MMSYVGKHSKVAQVVRSIPPRLRLVAVVGIASAGVASGIALTSGAGADTSDCASSVQTHNGVTANYCGSQALASLGLELAVTNKAAPYAQLTFKTSGANPATDFQFFNPASHPDNQKVAEWTPRGAPSGLCAAASNNRARVVLKVCKDSNPAQQWTAQEVGSTGTFEWVNELTGGAITDPGNGPAFTRATLADPVSASGQAFTYTQ